MEENKKVENLDVNSIRPGRNDRTVFDPASLMELADSIQEYGLNQPITVRPVLDLGCYFEIVAGERRFRAVHDILQWSTIPSIVCTMDNETASAIMLAENIGRRDLDPIDEAYAYQRRLDEFKWTIPELSKKCGVSTERITKRIKLVSVRKDIQALVRSGNFPIGHAEILSQLDYNRQMIAARPLVEGQSISLKEFRRLVDQLYTEQCQESLFDLELFGGSGNLAPNSVTTKAVSFPIAPDLPPLKLPEDHHTGAVIFAYIRDLQAGGFIREAEVIGTVLYWLDQTNFARIPLEASINSSVPERL